MITGINHINLSVSDIERSFAFYRDVMFFRPLCKWPRGAYFLAGNAWFCLNVPDDNVVSISSDYTHYAFSVAAQDFPAMVERLTNSGVQSFKDNRSEGASFYFLDPDGHKLEIHVGDWRSRLDVKKMQPWPDAQFFV